MKGQDLLEIVEPNDLFEYIIQLLETYSMQQVSNIAKFEKISKAIANKLVDIIEEANRFM
ncbi:17428_t:CDS:2 [Gigaspora margarita]|uniref:17428_t:CDS:1 n=1 Tax=Gigaspora margarita TaxID=4874 RepID=A0ABN7UIJ7_GIGMA|nr:17428_t:CDS:2 [Gigaspora margarita]